MSHESVKTRHAQHPAQAHLLARTLAVQAAAATMEVARCSASGCTAVGAVLRTCKGCKRVQYCGAACQKAHWGEGHKAACGAAARAT
jgi:hypothetical protein